MTPALAQALSHIAPAYSAREHTRAAERMVQDMEKTAHTPGPWKASYRTVDDAWRVETDNEETLVLGRAFVCEANARLIAASPDLLRALEDALPTLQSHMERYPNDKDERRIYDAARAAIAKAKAVNNG